MGRRKHLHPREAGLAGIEADRNPLQRCAQQGIADRSRELIGLRHLALAIKGDGLVGTGDLCPELGRDAQAVIGSRGKDRAFQGRIGGEAGSLDRRGQAHEAVGLHGLQDAADLRRGTPGKPFVESAAYGSLRHRRRGHGYERRRGSHVGLLLRASEVTCCGFVPDVSEFTCRAVHQHHGPMPSTRYGESRRGTGTGQEDCRQSEALRGGSEHVSLSTRTGETHWIVPGERLRVLNQTCTPDEAPTSSPRSDQTPLCRAGRSV